MRRPLIVFAAVLFVAACGPAAVPPTPTTPAATPTPTPTPIAPSPTPTPTPTPTLPPTPTPTPAAVPTPSPADVPTVVAIVDFAFEPAQVSIAAGSEVTWSHAGRAPHTVTFDDGTDSGQLDGGDTYSRTFAQAGTYDYHCAIHPTMTGTVTVD